MRARVCVCVCVFIIGPGSVPKRYDGCCSCYYRFRKMPKALLIRNGKLRNFAHTHTRDIIPDRSKIYRLGFFGCGRVPNRHDGCCSCCYRFRKMPKALLIGNGKLRNLAYTFVTSFPPVCRLRFFHQMAPPSGSVVPFVLVSSVLPINYNLA